MIRSDSKYWPPPKVVRRLHRRLLELRQLLVRKIEITNGSCGYHFRCESVREFNRCLKMFSKEPGTVEWITQEMKPGDVFYDIGANIGIFSIQAARRVEPHGKVYAFEPHSANFVRLVENVICNSLEGVVVSCNIPLHSREGFAYFHYESTTPGTANGQLSAILTGNDSRAPEVMSELKYATSIDRLIEGGRILPPQHVKIDIDGKELDVLQGMIHLLQSPHRPRTLQVELNGRRNAEIVALMQGMGYRLNVKHYSRSAARRMTRTAVEPTSGCNAIFIRTEPICSDRRPARPLSKTC
jgi:FkbM family methyltransferase